MQVQPPVQPVSLTPRPRGRRNHLLYVRAAWGEEWSLTVPAAYGAAVSTKYIKVPYVSEQASPGYSRAGLVAHVGTIRYEDEADFFDSPVLLLRGRFVKITLLPEDRSEVPGPDGPTVLANGDASGTATAEPAETEEKEEILFCGWVPEAEAAGKGHINYKSPEKRLDTAFTAFGLEYMLDRNVIGESYAAGLSPGSSEDYITWRITHALPFNENYQRGMTQTKEGKKQGNRSEMKQRLGSTKEDEEDPESPTVQDETTALVYVFDGGPGSELWSAYDIAEYLLGAFAPSWGKWELVPGRPGVGATAEKLFAALDGWKPTMLSQEGRTIKEIFDELFHRRHGLGWRVRLGTRGVEGGEDGEQEEVIRVEIFSTLDSPVSFGRELTVPASGRVVDLVVEPETPLSSLDVEEHLHARYGKVIVQGERVLSCFTLSYANGDLEKGWGPAEEAAYLAGDPNSNTANKNDGVRSMDRFRHVFTTFRVPKDWDGIVKTVRDPGDNSVVPTPQWGVAPTVKEDGTISPGSISEFVRAWGNSFERMLPIEAPQTQTTFDKEYRVAAAMLKDKAGQYRHADKPPGPGAVVRMLDRELGVEINPSRNHLIALGANLPTEHPSDEDPQFSYTSLLLTVALRTDQRLAVEETIAGGDANLVLRVTVPGAEAWWVQPGAILDVNADGSFVRHQGGVVRDDGDRLRQVASLIKAHYGRLRVPLRATLASVETGYEVGDVIGKLVEKHRPAESESVEEYRGVVGTVVSQRVIDLEKQATTIRTDFAELDFEMAGRLG